MTFHQDILTESIMRLIVSSKILEISKEILGQEIELELSRFHLTEGFSHVGNWHRDEKRKRGRYAVDLRGDEVARLVGGEHGHHGRGV